jgi:uncharacterized protein YcgI (DUF1989 family)
LKDVEDPSIQHSRYRLDKAFYDGVRTAERRLVEKLVVAPFSGRGFVVRRGQTFRVIEEEGPQVGDVAFWNADDPKETLSCLRTWEMEGWLVKPYSRLWSDVPWLRPMATCIDDKADLPGDDDKGQRHFLASHCSAEQMEMRTGRAGMNGCRLNLLQAIEPFGLSEENLRENIDIFTQFVLEPDSGMLYAARTEATTGDYIEFYAEIDLLVAVSVCHYDESAENGDYTALPLGIQTYDTGIAPKEYSGWTDWRPEWRGKWVPPRQDGEGI